MERAALIFSVNEVDLEEGEIEDEEPPEEGEVRIPDEVPPTPKVEAKPLAPVIASPVKREEPRTPVLRRTPRHHASQNARRPMGQRLYREPLITNTDSDPEEDDWASNVEKALKAALAGTEGAATVTNSTSATLTKAKIELSDEESKEKDRMSPEDEKRLKKKKRKKKHREGDEDDEDELKDSKKRRRSHHRDVWDDKEDAGDEDEMLFVRGASPSTRNSYHHDSPSGRNAREDSFYNEQGGGFDDNYDSFHDEESDYEMRDDYPARRGDRGSDDDSMRRGIGRGSKRRPLRGGPSLGRGGNSDGSGQRGGHLKRSLLTRKDMITGKGVGSKMRGGMRRLGRDNHNRSENVCMFYLQGNCHKGDDCPYSHSALPARKLELCKFYLMGCCAKKDKCLYLHEAFPCKFFHTGLKCFSGSRCKFSHGPLSDQMKTVLMKHLETAPKDLLGDYPRHGRDSGSGTPYGKRRDGDRGDRSDRGERERGRERSERSDRAERGERTERSERGTNHRNSGTTGNGKRGPQIIPSLFDIEVPIHVQRLAEAKDMEGDEQSPARRSTPMPESDNEDDDQTVNTSKVDSKSSRSKESKWLSDDSLPFGSSRDFSTEKTPDRKNRDYSDQHEEQKPTFRFYQDTLSSDEGDRKKETSSHKKKESRTKKESSHRRSKRSPDIVADENPSPKKVILDIDVEEEKTDDTPMEIVINTDSVDNGMPQTDVVHENRDSQPETGESGTESNDGSNIPLHLPKKQRELFLRIQQQQREADSSQDRSGDNDEEEENCADENWYSSDDEDVPLTDVLKKLSKQEPEQHTVEVPPLLEQNERTPPKESEQPAPPIIPAVGSLMLSDLSHISISESVTKLLSSIRNQGVVPTPTPTSTTETQEILPASTVVLPSQSPQLQGSSPAIRDPRMSRDPRNRTVGTVANTTAVSDAPQTPVATGPPGLMSPGTTPITTTTETSPHLPRRPDPRTARADPRKAAAAAAAAAVGTTPLGASPGGDEGSAKNIVGPPPRRSSFTSIYSNAITSPGDVDLRSLPQAAPVVSATAVTGDVDLRHVADTDLRRLTSFTGASDTDLRPRLPADPINKDVDLRRVLELPFKPVPMHTPATEIEASLNSHPPIPYKVTEITVPRPDYTRLKLSTSDPQVESDPRLRRIFKLPDPPATTPPKPTNILPAAPRTDPRRLATPAQPTPQTAASRVATSQTAAPASVPTTSPAPETMSLPAQQVPFCNMTDMGQLGVSMMGPAMPVIGMGTAMTVDPRVARTVAPAKPGLLGAAPPGFPVASNPALMGMQMPFFPMGEGDAGAWNPLQPQLQRPAWRGGRRNVSGPYGERDFVGRQSFTPPL